MKLHLQTTEERGKWIMSESKRHSDRNPKDVIADLLVLEVEVDAMHAEIERLKGENRELRTVAADAKWDLVP